MKNKIIYFLGLGIIFLTCSLTISCLNSQKNQNKINKNEIIEKNGEIESKIKLNYLTTENVKVIFWNSKGKISTKQSENLTKFTKQEKILFDKIKTAVFDYYKSVYKDYKDGIDLANMDISKEQLEEILPTPTTPQNLFKSYEIGTIHIEQDKNCKIGTIGLEFHCDWDVENGLGIKIENWEIKKIGVAEYAYF